MDLERNEMHARFFWGDEWKGMEPSWLVFLVLGVNDLLP